MAQQQPNAFRRAAGMSARIGAILQACAGNTMLAQSQIQALGQYVSRGKGGGYRFKTATARFNHMSQVRKSKTKRNIAKRK